MNRVLPGLGFLLVTGLGLAGCDDGSGLPPPVVHGRRALHPDARGAIRRCQAALDTMFSLPLRDQLALTVRVCSELYVETECRDAMTQLGDVAPTRRTAYLAAACQRAYCGRLPLPMPDLCHVRGERALRDTDPAALRTMWRAFNSAVFLRDLATAHPLEGVVFRYLETEPRDVPRGREADSADAVRLRLERRGRTYSLVAVGSESAVLPDGFSESDVARALKEDLELRPGTPLALAIDARANTEAGGRFLRGAAVAGFDRITMQPPF